MLKNQNVQDLVDAYRARKRVKKRINQRRAFTEVAWHPDRAYDWCFDEDHKGDIELLSKV